MRDFGRNILFVLLLLCGWTAGYGFNWVLTNTDDDLNNPSVGSLRWAIQQAVDGDSISFPESLTTDPELFLEGTLNIDKSLKILGPVSFTLRMWFQEEGQEQIVIGSMVRGVRIENIHFTAETLDGSASPDGLIVVEDGGELVIRNCIMEQYGTDIAGTNKTYGAFLINEGDLSLDSCSIERNFPGGTGKYVIENEPGKNLIIRNSSFLLNQSQSTGVIRNQGWMEFRNNEYLFNGPKGGNMFVAPSARALIVNSVFQGNVEGGIWNQGFVQVDTCNFIQNFGTTGTTIYNEDSLIINSCYFEQNVASSEGGAIYNEGTSSIFSIKASCFYQNEGSDAGAIFLESGDGIIQNCTFSSNKAELEGGAVKRVDAGLHISHSTFFQNQSEFVGGAIHSVAFGAFIEPMTFSNTLFVGNFAPQNPDIFTSTFFGSLPDTSLGFNIVGDTTNADIFWTSTDILALANLTDKVLLDDIADNGGPTPTHALLLDSTRSTTSNLAIDAGDPTSTVLVDQRGIDRKAPPDIGAFEYSTVKIQKASTFVCLDGGFLPLDSVVIEDTNGGAILPGVNQALILGLPAGLSFQPNTGMATASPGSGIEIRSTIIGTNSLTISYDKTFVTQGGNIVLSGLNIQAIEDTGTFELLRLGGNAVQTGNEPLDSLAHAEIKVVGNVVAADFAFRNVCLGDSTTFMDQTILNEGIPRFWQWDFGDQNTTSLDPMPTHKFSLAESYQVQLIVGANAFCVDTISREVSVLDTISVTPDVPYDETFEFGAEWVQNDTSSSWKWGEVGTSFQPRASNDNVWATNKQGTYKPNESSWVNSPCLDLRGLQRPVWSMDIFTDMQEGFDGAVMQVSKDGGVIWQTVGEILEEEDSTGIEWYNEDAIIGNPGQQDSLQQGWSSRLPLWRTARHALDTIVENSNGFLRFRVAFGSDASQPSALFQGFAFDNVSIRERDRLLLLEHFINLNESVGLSDSVLALQEDTRKDVLSIQYHTKEPLPDPLFETNWQDNSARSLYYGISNPGQTLVDGNYFHGAPNDLNRNAINLRALEPSFVDISIDTSLGIVELRPTESRLDELLVMMAIVEDSVPHPTEAGVFMDNVLRKVLPDASGTYFPGPISAGIPITLVPIWESNATPSPSIANDLNALRLVVWVQDPNTKEIFDAASSAVGASMIGQREGLPPEEEASFFAIFPNPTTDWLYVQWKELLPDDGDWRMWDARGRMVGAGPIPKDKIRFGIEVHELAEGIYTLEMNRPNQTPIRRKVMVRK